MTNEEFIPKRSVIEKMDEQGKLLRYLATERCKFCKNTGSTSGYRKGKLCQTTQSLKERIRMKRLAEEAERLRQQIVIPSSASGIRNFIADILPYVEERTI